MRLSCERANNQELNSEGLIDWQKQNQLDQMQFTTDSQNPIHEVNPYDLIHSKTCQEENRPNPKMVPLMPY